MSAHDELIEPRPRGALGRFRAFREERPHLFLLVLMMLVAFFMMDPRTWVVLTISGLAMGAMVFLMASGMTLTFGLMNVLNLAHGAFISLGAFAGATVLVHWLNGQAGEASVWANLAAVLPALGFALVVAGLIGLLFERLVIKPVYGDHLKQILVTVGGSIILMELIQVVWATRFPCPGRRPLPAPSWCRNPCR